MFHVRLARKESKSVKPSLHSSVHQSPVPSGTESLSVAPPRGRVRRWHERPTYYASAPSNDLFRIEEKERRQFPQKGQTMSLDQLNVLTVIC